MSTPSHCRRQAGFSLIELLVSMVIGLVVTLAITSVLVRSEGTKRSTTSVNDINQTGAYAAFVLDRHIRSAGSGFSQAWTTAYGCLLDASKGSTRILPNASMFTSTTAFKNLTTTTFPIRLAPVIIGQGMANVTSPSAETRGDVLMVMSGTGGASEMPQTAQVTSAQATLLNNSVGYQDGDVVLITDTGAAGCLIEEVRVPPAAGSCPTTITTPSTAPVPASGGTQNALCFGGPTLYTSAGTNVSPTSFTGNPLVLQLGNVYDPANANPPRFQMYGVGANTTLMAFDLLQVNGAELPIADGVLEMRALYGVDTTSPPDAVMDAWASPSGTEFAASVLTSGTDTARASLRKIVAVRVGFILRTSLQERTPASGAGALQPEGYQRGAATIRLFDGVTDASGNSLAYTRTLTGTELNYRYRTVEVTIPLRNVLMAPQS